MPYQAGVTSGAFSFWMWSTTLANFSGTFSASKPGVELRLVLELTALELFEVEAFEEADNGEFGSW